MSILSDEPGKVARAAYFFLPGFAALGLVTQVTDLSLNEFAFTYIAVALSILIYGVTRILNPVLGALSASSASGPPPTSPPGYPAGPGNASQAPAAGFAAPDSAFDILVTCVVTAFVAGACIQLYEQDRLLRVVRWLAPGSTGALSSHPPMRMVLERAAHMQDEASYTALPEADRFLNLVDNRPAGAVPGATCEKGIAGTACSKQRYTLLLRIRLGDSWIEGVPRLHQRTRDKPPGELVLSPACRVEADKNGRFAFKRRADGPGFVVLERQVQELELIDHCGSSCFLHYFPEARATCQASLAEVDARMNLP